MMILSLEFDGEEYKVAKVDPISQFAKPITVNSLIFIQFLGVLVLNVYFLCQSHMNKDHAEDTKAIVQYSTSVKVLSINICLFNFFLLLFSRAIFSGCVTSITETIIFNQALNVRCFQVDFAHMLDVDKLGFNVKVELIWMHL